MIDAHHHLWDLNAVHYPWLMAQGLERFFGDPSPIQRDYLIDEFRAEASACGITGSVHIQVGAEDAMAEAQWVQSIADATPDWPMAQVVFCDLTAPDLPAQLDKYQRLSTVKGVRQIIGRAPGEDAVTGTNDLLDNPAFLKGLKEAGDRGLSFDLQLIPELMEKTATIIAQAPDTPVALCHAGSPHDRTEAGLANWARSLRHLSDLPHVTCKLSGLGMFEHNWTQESLAPIVEEVIGQFGQNRVMFGSNFPVDKLYSDYQKIFETQKALVSSDHHDQVFNSVARAFYF